MGYEFRELSFGCIQFTIITMTIQKTLLETQAKQTY
jgi:hypothetical protein